MLNIGNLDTGTAPTLSNVKLEDAIATNLGSVDLDERQTQRFTAIKHGLRVWCGNG